MAGLGFKDFAVGEVLTAADVDGYLMQQSVMRFASDAARGSALGTAVGTAVALAEGMFAYLDDVAGRGGPQFYDGAGWRTLAGVLQVVQTVKTSIFSTTSTSLVDITDLSVTITPLSATSKVLVAYHAPFSISAGANVMYLQLVRDSTDIYEGSGGTTNISNFAQPSEAYEVFDKSGMFLDSPATTSATTYKLQMSVGGGTGYVGRKGDSSAIVFPSQITVMEVAA